MFLRLFLLFTTVTLLELYLIVQLMIHTSLGFTLLLVLGSGILGAWLARREGIRTLNAIRNQLQQGRVPAAQMIDGIIILMAGALLLTPGLLTDLAGLSALIPQVRARIRNRLKGKFKEMVESGNATIIIHRGPE